MNQQKFPIVIHQKPTIAEIFFITLITLITFVPFIYGIETKRPIFCSSMIIGVIFFKIFNTVTKGKFTIQKIIQKNTTISFSSNCIEINENQDSIIHYWKNLEEVEVNIYAYKGRYYGSDSKSYDGIENSIVFVENGQKFKYRFYIDNVNQFKALKEQFHKTILPILNQYQNLKEEGYLQAQFNFARNYNNLNNDTDYL